MNKEKIGLVLIGLVALICALTGVFKIVGAEEAAEGFGNPNAPYILAIVEFTIAAAIAIPRTRLLGVILAASYFGGVIAFSWLAEKELPLPGIAISIVLYLGAALYRPFLTNNGQVPVD